MVGGKKKTLPVDELRLDLMPIGRFSKIWKPFSLVERSSPSIKSPDSSLAGANALKIAKHCSLGTTFECVDEKKDWLTINLCHFDEACGT